MRISDVDVIYESFKHAKENFIVSADEAVVNQYINRFKILSSKNIISGIEKDIGTWTRLGWDSFKEFVDRASIIKTNAEVKKTNKSKTIIVYDDEDKLVLIPLSVESSILYGKKTKWCTSSTTSDNEFETYFYDEDGVLFYVIMRDSGEKYSAIYRPEDEDYEFFDSQNNYISLNNFTKHTKIERNDLDNWRRKHKNKIADSKMFNDLSDQSQIEMVSKKPIYVKYIDNPSEAVQLAAVQQYGGAIEHIANPTEAVQLAAVKQDRYSIYSINKPTKRVKELHKELWG